MKEEYSHVTRTEALNFPGISQETSVYIATKLAALDAQNSYRSEQEKNNAHGIFIETLAEVSQKPFIQADAEKLFEFAETLRFGTPDPSAPQK
jgi:hypothetical protein